MSQALTIVIQLIEHQKRDGDGMLISGVSRAYSKIIEPSIDDSNPVD